MLLQFLASVLLFAGLCLGVAWPVMARREMAAAEKLVATITLSLIGIFLWAWVVYILALPRQTLYLLPALAVGGLALRRRELRALLVDRSVVALLGAQALVTAGCIAWLATIESYSGGGWAGDWHEHWERTRFFLEDWPRDTKFIGQYALTARPPLANVVTAAWLALTRADFVHYQLLTTLCASIAFLPAALFALRWGGVRAVPILAVLLLVSPLFVQNATFAWTKLPAALFTLASLYFFLRAREDAASRGAAILCAASLAAGLLTHYSTGPYAVAIAGAWLCVGWRRRGDAAWRQQTLLMAATGTALLATWFAWSFSVYGAGGTLLTNSSVTSADARQGNQLVKMGLNLFDTFIPHFMRELDTSLIAQRSPWGYVRDWWFQNYQINLFFAFGTIACAALLRELVRVGRVEARQRALWIGLVATIVVLGVVTHGQRDHWGLAHICLQALVILGLAFLAARWAHLGRGWRLALIAGGTVDFLLGIALHFGVQNFALDRWFAAHRPVEDTLTSYSSAALLNLQGKIHHKLAFVANSLGAPFALCAAVAVGILVLAILRTRTPSPPANGGGTESRDDPSAATNSSSAAKATHRDPWLAAGAVAALACGLAHLWSGWCAFPISSWNEVRLAPAFALRHGLPVYPPVGGGPLSTWIYGPVGVLINLPATLAPSVIGAIETAGAINLAMVALPLVVVCVSAAELRVLDRPALLLALGIVALALPPQALAYQVADHTAIALGLLSCWFLTRRPVPTTFDCGMSAALCIASLWAKQLAVFVPLAQLIFLWLQPARATVARYVAWLAGFGLGSILLNSAVFGFGNLWLNLVVIPGRLPSADFAAKALGELPWLVAYVALPLAAVAALRVFRCWPDRDTASGRLLRCTLLVSVALLPIGLMAFFKIGGATNVVHSWYYLLAPLVIATVSAAWLRRHGWIWLTLAAIALCGLRLPELQNLPARPFTAHLREAQQIAAAGKGTIWFPYNPLVTFYSDGKLYHDDDGIMTRELARLGARDVDARHLPSPLSAIVYNALQTSPVALRFFPSYQQRTLNGHWALYRPKVDSAP